MQLTVTVCEMPDDAEGFAQALTALRAHTGSEATDLLVLNEAPRPWADGAPAPPVVGRVNNVVLLAGTRDVHRQAVEAGAGRDK